MMPVPTLRDLYEWYSGGSDEGMRQGDEIAPQDEIDPPNLRVKPPKHPGKPPRNKDSKEWRLWRSRMNRYEWVRDRALHLVEGPRELRELHLNLLEDRPPAPPSPYFLHGNQPRPN